ncbi:hypothetical protein C0585_03715 [Candidatus Woesearchaeota archaeon]|nr:MAG: hypothetical protein C0585_03715 [Candidatus Woesearchaeota archaeon]
MTSTAEITEKYIENHPSIKDCLKKELLNYTQLSKLIAKELEIRNKTSIEAIQIAARRYIRKIKSEDINEDKIIEILKQSELEIKNKVVTIVIEKLYYPEKLIEIELKIKKNKDLFYSIEGSNAITIVTNEKYFEEIKKLFSKNLLETHKNLILIKLKSPKIIEKVPGIAGFIYSKFAENGVNIIETMSCWTDNLFIIEEDHLSEVMGFLKF